MEGVILISEKGVLRWKIIVFSEGLSFCKNVYGKEN
jgi:hypothetical protein